MLFHHAQAKLKKLELQISSLQSQLSHLPEGKIICAKNGSGFKWYNSDGKKKVYIPKKERFLAEQLAYKKYLSLKLEECLQEKVTIESYLKHHNSSKSSSQDLLTTPGYQELLSSVFVPDSEELTSWMNAPYETNPKYQEGLTYKTSSGLLVRSKSEAMIAMLLQIHRIPFRYECALHLGPITMYPDFTLRHPVTGKTFYYEHFGMMDEPHYREITLDKLSTYTSHGIIPTIQLIATYETKEHPLSPDTIENIIKQYFS